MKEVCENQLIGYFDVLENQRFASVELFFLPVLFKWLTVFSMCLIISGLQRWDYFFLPVLSKWLTIVSMCLRISGLWWWVVVLFLCFKNDL